MSDNGNAGSNVTGFIIGALVGAGLALMYAPCSGTDMRQWLTRKTKNFQDKTESAFEETKAKVRGEAKYIMGEAKDVVGGQAARSYAGAGDKSRT